MLSVTSILVQSLKPSKEFKCQHILDLITLEKDNRLEVNLSRIVFILEAVRCKLTNLPNLLVVFKWQMLYFEWKLLKETD